MALIGIAPDVGATGDDFDLAVFATEARAGGGGSTHINRGVSVTESVDEAITLQRCASEVSDTERRDGEAAGGERWIDGQAELPRIDGGLDDGLDGIYAAVDFVDERVAGGIERDAFVVTDADLASVEAAGGGDERRCLIGSDVNEGGVAGNDAR